jgi:hypothetical protein
MTSFEWPGKKLILGAMSLICLSCVGCAPGLGRSVTISPVPLPNSEEVRSDFEGSRGALGNFEDARNDKTVVSIDGRSVSSEQDVGALLREGIQLSLRRGGAQIVLFDAPTLSGQVTKWHATVEPGFPASRIVATAGFDLSVAGSDGSIAYRASYSGEMEQKHPFLNETRISDTLAAAMKEAVREALSDSKLREALSTF